MYYPENAVFVTGVAKVSRDDAINTMYGTFSLSLVVDSNSHRILDVSANTVMQQTNDFIAQIMIGQSLVSDVNKISESIHKRFLALSQKAVLVALRDAQNHYFMAFPEARAAK